MAAPTFPCTSPRPTRPPRPPGLLLATMIHPPSKFLSGAGVISSWVAGTAKGMRGSFTFSTAGSFPKPTFPDRVKETLSATGEFTASLSGTVEVPRFTASRECCRSVPRRNAIASMMSSFLFLQMGSQETSLADPSNGFREYIDLFDGYTFMYPRNWIQVRGAGADIFFRDPFVLDENLSVELSSPSSSRFKTIADLGPPEAAADKVLKQYLTEFMSTRLGVRRESNVLSTSSRVADDGRVYYQVEVNIKSYANSNELAVMPQDRVPRLEWDRRYLSVLGVENNRLYELRLQTPENVFVEEEKDLRDVMDSFRVIKAVN